MPRNVKTVGKGVVHRPGRAPFVAALQAISSSKAVRFTTIESTFLNAMWDFDVLVRAGQTTQGDRQNGKGDFLNDVLALLLERRTKKQLHSRGTVPGLLFPKHALDVAYPATGVVEMTIETKATGSPKHPGSEKQHETGRAGAADLEKRIKEAAFKDIDIKGEYARQAGAQQGASTNLMTWLRTAPPHNWLFLSVRVRNKSDLDRTVEFAQTAARWFRDCGLFAYGHADWDLAQPYEAKSVPRSVDLDRVLNDVANHLAALQ